MRSLRLVLFGLAAGSQIAFWVLSTREVGGAPVPLPLTIFAVILVGTWWVLGRRRPRRPWGTLVACLAVAAWSMGVGFILQDHGVQSLALPLQACACLAFAGFVLVDRRVLRHPDEPARSARASWAAPAAVGAWALALVTLFAALNPVTELANQRPQPDKVVVGDVNVSIDEDSLSGFGTRGRWGYTHAGSSLGDWPDSNGQVLIPSPDGAYVAANFVVGLPDEPGLLQHVVVFESATGRVAARASFSGFVNVQLTNSVVLMGRDAYSLSGGSLLWSADVGSPLRRSMTAAPEQLITDTECERSDDGLYDCLLHVLPQDDPDAETRIVRALTDPATNQIVVVDGWTLTSKAPVQPDAGGRVSRSLVAVNLGTGESVEVGEGVGPDGSEFGRLGIRPASDPLEPDAAASWFDPETKQVQR